MKVKVQSYTLKDIHSGMFACFSREMGRHDVEVYASMVGDISPLHVNSSYGVRTEFGNNLVHGMLISSLFSTLVGVLLPGRNALLSSIEIDFSRPVPVGSRVMVTGSVMAVLPGGAGFQVRLIAYVCGEVCVRGSAIVKIRAGIEGDTSDATVELEEAWVGTPSDLKTALVTGATGLIGKAICSKLAHQGWQIGVHYHENETGAQTLLNSIRKEGGNGCLLKGDLADGKAVRELVDRCRRQLGPIGTLIHGACPSFKPTRWLSPEDGSGLYAVQIGGLKLLLAEILPDMLRAQYGHVLTIVSDAIHPPFVPGWQDYITVKHGLQGLISALASSYDGCGLCVGSVVPGAVQGDSKLIGKHEHRQLSGALSVRGLADAIAGVMDTTVTFPNGSVLFLGEEGRSEVHKRGLLADSRTLMRASEPPARQMHTARQDEEDREVSGKPDPVREELRQIFYDTLKLDHNTPLGENARLGVLSSWDSLSHLKLLMAVETAFDVTVENVEELYTFDRLLKAIRARTQS